MLFRILFSENSTTTQHLVANSGRIFNPLIAHIVCKLPTQCDDMFPISITIHHIVCIKCQKWTFSNLKTDLLKMQQIFAY